MMGDTPFLFFAIFGHFFALSRYFYTKSGTFVPANS